MSFKIVFCSLEECILNLSYRNKAIFFYIGLILALLPFFIYYLFQNFEYLFTNLVFFSSWESLTAVTLCIGSVSYLETVFKKPSQIISSLGSLTFTIYVIHVIFVVFFQIIFESLSENPIIKFVLVSLFSIITSIIFAYLLHFISLNLRKSEYFRLPIRSNIKM